MSQLVASLSLAILSASSRVFFPCAFDLLAGWEGEIIICSKVLASNVGLRIVQNRVHSMWV